MLIRFFRSSFMIQYMVLVLIGAGLWIPAFLAPPLPVVPASPVTPLYNILIRWVVDIAWLPTALGLLLVFAEAFILNNIFIYHDLAPKNSLLPSFLFVLFMSSGAMDLTLTPALAGMLPLTFFLHQLYQLYDEPENLNKMLAVGLLASISSMIYTPFLLLILFIWIAFLIYRTLQWREWVIALIGFTIPYLYLVVYYFWRETLAENALAYLDYFLSVFSVTASRDILQIIIWSTFALFILLPSVMRVVSTMGSHNIAFRRKMSITIWLAVFGAFMVFIHGNIGDNVFLYLPAVGIIAFQYFSVKRSAWNELVVLAYFVMIAVHNYLMM